MTESGREVVPKVQDALSRVKTKTRKGITDDQYDLLNDLLKKVLSNLSEQEEM